MRLFLIVPLLAFAACAKEKPAVSKAEKVVDREGGITDDTKVPADADSRKFADHLVRNPLTNFSPTDGGAAGFKWTEVKFGPKNHWIAQAILTADGESINCVESGDWSMDKADSDHTATVALRTEKTTCPGRNDAAVYRMQMTWEKDDYNVVFR